MKYSIIPEIITSKKIQFFDERDVPVLICKPSKFKYIPPFSQPYLLIDTFAKKTTLPSELVFISIEELRKLGFIITMIKAGAYKWFSRQQVIYRIEDVSNPSPKSKRMKITPANHKIQRDKVNKRIRLVGLNAGYPHRGTGGPWIELKEK